MNDLNKKLAEWRWPDATQIVATTARGANLLYLEFADGRQFNIVCFSDSVDASFQELVPKLRDAYSLFLQYDAVRDDFCCYLAEVDDEGVAAGETEYGFDLLNLKISAWAKTPSLALCLAIEKLLEEEK